MRKFDLSDKKNVSEAIIIMIIYALAAVSLPYREISVLFGGTPAAEYTAGFICKAVCSVLPFYFIFAFGFKGELAFSERILKGLPLCIPAFIVAVNNFPIIPLAFGDATFDIYKGDILPYILYCLSIGLMEEVIFRGNILPLFMCGQKKNKKGLFSSVIYSSLIFGGMHLLNLLGGFSVSVFLQVGYSFLIGALCALCLLFTGNLFAAVIVHAVFDTGGFLFGAFGTGVLWTTENVVITAVIGVSAAVALTAAFFKTDFSSVYGLWGIKRLTF